MLICAKLARHQVGEEIVVYPLMQEKLSNGEELVSKDRKDHHQVAESLFKLQEKKTSDPEFPQIFKQVMDELRQHVKSEEEKDIPELEAVLSREESEKLAKLFSKTKNFAPTRSHPYATSFEPPFETALALITAPIDKVCVN
jgi:iron-sulfur cluster repair protein YtfE (RIC family)